MFWGWAGDRMSGNTLAMHHRLSSITNYVLKANRREWYFRTVQCCQCQINLIHQTNAPKRSANSWNYMFNGCGKMCHEFIRQLAHHNSNSAATSASWQTTHSEWMPRAVTSRGIDVATATSAASLSVGGGAVASFGPLTCLVSVGFFT